MSTGAIICVTNNAPAKWNQEKETQFRRQVVEAFNMIRIVSSKADRHLLYFLWMDLITKGMTNVVIATAKFTANGRLELDRDYCRLPVISLN